MNALAGKIHTYKLLARCGRGAFGDVFIAEDAVGRRVALKTVERASAAAKEISGLQHYARIGDSKNLIRIFHIEELPDFLYYTMELADNLHTASDDPEQYIPATLSNILAQKKRLSPGEAKHIALELLAGLQELHGHQLIHRDIKPENIMIVNGTVKLSDIGLVRSIDHTITFGGTLEFIPPERLKSGDSHPIRDDDLYAVGKVLYCMMTGYPPEKYPQIPPDLIRQEDVRDLNRIITTACSRNPLLRFRTAGEFAAALNQGKITSRKKALQWGFRLKYLPLAVPVLALAAILAVKIPEWRADYRMVLQARKVKQDETVRKSKEFVTYLLNNRAPLEIQLARQMPAEDARRFFRKVDSILSLAPEKGAKLREECRAFLKEQARKALAPIPASTGNLMEDMKISGQARILPHSVLGDFLAPEQKKTYLNELEAWENRHLRSHWQGTLAPGKTVAFDYVRWDVFIYIPPGEFDSVFDGVRRRVEYPMWVADKEVLAEKFRLLTGYEPGQKHGMINQPTLFIGWNDVLEFCRGMTVHLQKTGELPPGYIVRPLTEVEWEWAMRGAWQGDSAPGSAVKIPNRAGIYKIRECDEYVLNTLPEVLEPDTVKLMRKTAIGTKKWSKTTSYYYQCFYDKSAFRTVIAPGDMSYFARHFRYKTEPQAFDSDGRHFELISSIFAISQENARSFCSFVGGRLAVLDTPEKQKLASQYYNTRGWPVIVAGDYRDGAWRWPDGRVIPDAPKPPPSTIHFFCFRNNKFDFFPHSFSPAFICEWSQKEWQERLARPGRWDHPLVQKKFSIGTRQFAVIRFNSNISNIQTLVRLLGGKPVTPEPADFRKQLFEKLADIPEPVALGGHYFFGQWRTNDLTVVGNADTIRETGRIFSKSPYLHLLTVWKKELWHTQRTDYFLLEIPPPAPQK